LQIRYNFINGITYIWEIAFLEMLFYEK
jgi:hypothetical protein